MFNLFLVSSEGFVDLSGIIAVRSDFNIHQMNEALPFYSQSVLIRDQVNDLARL